VALCAHARFAASEDDEAHGRALFRICRDDAVRLFGGCFQLDYPAAGQLLFALGSWTLLRQPAQAGPAPAERVPPEVALRLLALAARFSYSRAMPSMTWEEIAQAAEQALPGRLAELAAGYAAGQPADPVDEALRLAELLPG
jgi:hypothetical protein